MKKITTLLLFATIFYTNAQISTLQIDEACNIETVSKPDARQIIEKAAFSFMGPHLEKSLKRAVSLENDTNEAIIHLPENCFAPDTDPAVVAEFYQNRTALLHSLGIPEEEQGFRFNLGPRWDATATDGSGLNQGDMTTLTWSYVPDGTAIGNGGCNRPDQGTFSSDFIAFFNGIYGPPTTAGDYTTAPWHTVFVNMFNSWSSVSGLNFVYEPNDDGVTVITGGDGVLGVRGDMRISGHRIDGNSNVLACNYFPTLGDMVIDTADNFFSNNPGIGTTNVLTHEIGHGIGIAHVCPINQTKLMEPFVTTAFQGPQEDDILAVNRHYGDIDGDNDTSATATFLGANALPTSYSQLQRSVDDNGDTDYFSFTTSEAAILELELTPTGSTYLEGTQNSNGSCSPGTPFSASNVSDLMLELLDTDGNTVLVTLSGNGPAQVESIMNYSLPAAGTYFVKISQQGTSVNNVQMYDLDVNLEVSAGDPPPSAACVAFTAQLDATGNVTIAPADVDGGSNDANGPVTLSVSPTSFTCDDVGPNAVILTVTDNTGQTSSCTTTVTVEDTIAPIAICMDTTVQIDSSCSVTITPADINNGSTDNCGLTTIAVTPDTFTCADIGPNTVTLVLVDENGNGSTCTSIVTVEASLGVEETTISLSTLDIFPNPAKDNIILSNPQNLQLRAATIYDITGRLVQKVDLSETLSETEINLSQLKSGTYMFVISTNKSSITKQLVKN